MIAIKSMKNIPKSCVECELLQHGGFCYYKSPPYELSSYDILDERPKDCPLVEIVTCKDCKYARQSEDNDRYCYLSGKYHDIDYFCADAERRK